MKHLQFYENFRYNKYNFKKGDIVIWLPFDNQKVEVLDVTDENTLWIKDKNGNVGEFLSKDFIPETEFKQKIYNI